MKKLLLSAVVAAMVLGIGLMASGCTTYTSSTAPQTTVSRDVFTLVEEHVAEGKRLVEELLALRTEREESLPDIGVLKENGDFQTLMTKFDNALWESPTSTEKIKKVYDDFMSHATPQNKDYYQAIVYYHQMRTVHALHIVKWYNKVKAHDEKLNDLKNKIIMSYATSPDSRLMALMVILNNENSRFNSQLKELSN